MVLRAPAGSPQEVIHRADEAIELAAIAGLYLDDWQQDCMAAICCLREDEYYNQILDAYEPKWAASEYGVVVARQNGKGAIIEARALAGLFLWGEQQIVYTAHHGRTMRQMFKRMRLLTETLVKNDQTARSMLRNIMAGNGAEGIYLHSGQEMLFSARSQTALRGLSCDVLILDEAMAKLEEEEIEACRPAVSARPNFQILNFGSAGNEDSQYFGAVRNKILKVYDLGVKFHPLSPRTGWTEYSVELHTEYCDPDCTVHDDRSNPLTWAKTNPNLGVRLNIETIEDEFDTMTENGFNRERLSVGRWPVEGGGWRVIPKEAWDSQRRTDLAVGDVFCLAVDTAPDDDWTCITACGATSGDPELAMVEITTDAETGDFDYKPGSGWAIARIEKIYKATRFPFVVIDPSTPAGALIKPLEAKNIPVLACTGRDYNHGCGEFLTAIAPKKGNAAKLVHSNQAHMETAAGNADRKNRVELWSWDKTSESADITPITSATKAYWGYLTHIYKKTVTPFFFFGD